MYIRRTLGRHSQDSRAISARQPGMIHGASNKALKQCVLMGGGSLTLSDEPPPKKGGATRHRCRLRRRRLPRLPPKLHRLRQVQRRRLQWLLLARVPLARRGGRPAHGRGRQVTVGGTMGVCVGGWVN